MVWATIVATQAAGLAAARLVLNVVLKAAVPSAPIPVGDAARLTYTLTSDNSG